MLHSTEKYRRQTRRQIDIAVSIWNIDVSQCTRLSYRSRLDPIYNFNTAIGVRSTSLPHNPADSIRFSLTSNLFKFNNNPEWYFPTLIFYAFEYHTKICTWNVFIDWNKKIINWQRLLWSMINYINDCDGNSIQWHW